MLVEMRANTSIRPYENNPRLNDAAIDAVAASIREFGFRQPIVVDEQGVIIVGHTRYFAALKLKMTEVPVHVAVGLTPAQARAYRIADNQTATLSSWTSAAWESWRIRRQRLKTIGPWRPTSAVNASSRRWVTKSTRSCSSDGAAPAKRRTCWANNGTA